MWKKFSMLTPFELIYSMITSILYPCVVASFDTLEMDVDAQFSFPGVTGMTTSSITEEV